MDGLSTSTFLYKRCIPLSAQMQCPVCHKPFKAYEGKLFFCNYAIPDTDECQKGVAILCSAICFLISWVPPPRKYAV